MLNTFIFIRLNEFLNNLNKQNKWNLDLNIFSCLDYGGNNEKSERKCGKKREIDEGFGI